MIWLTIVSLTKSFLNSLPKSSKTKILALQYWSSSFWKSEAAFLSFDKFGIRIVFKVLYEFTEDAYKKIENDAMGLALIALSAMFLVLSFYIAKQKTLNAETVSNDNKW